MVQGIQKRLPTRFAWCAAIAIAVAAAYSNGVTDSFVGADGKASIRDNPYIERLWPLSDAASVPMWGAAGAAVDRRPVLSVAFALNRALLGPEPWGFHVVNIAIHFCAALVLFALAGMTLRTPALEARYGSASEAVAGAIALLWAVHPLQTESVTYLVQRAESLAGLFVLLTMWLSARRLIAARGGARGALAVACCALAMGTNEAAAAAPILVLAWDRVFVCGGFAAALRRSPWLYLGLASTWAIPAGLLLASGTGTASPLVGERSFQYALSQPGVVVHYLSAVVWPHPLYLHAGGERFWVDPLAMPIGAVVALAAVCALVATTAYGCVQSRPWSFLGVWLLAILAPTSSVVAAHDVVQDHRMYLPSAAVIAAVVLVGHARLSAIAAASLRRALAVGLLGCATVALAVVSHARNFAYHDELGPYHPDDLGEVYMTLGDYYQTHGLLAAETEKAVSTLAGSDGAEVSDARARTFASFLAGLTAASDGRLEEAAAQLGRSIEAMPAFPQAHVQLALVRIRQGRTADAEAELRAALTLSPRCQAAHFRLGVLLASSGRSDEAIAHLGRAIALEPGHAQAHARLGALLAAHEQSALALSHLERALLLRPGDPESQLEKGLTLAAGGRDADAAAALERAVALRPQWSQARLRLAASLAATGRAQSAREQVLEAQRLAPDSGDAAYEGALILLELGDNDGARVALERAARLLPDRAEPHYQLARMLAQQDRAGEAIARMQRALEIDPRFARAHHEMAVMLLRVGAQQEARRHLQKALGLDPRRADSRFELAMLQLRDGDQRRALTGLRRAISDDAGLASAHYELGRLLLGRGSIGRAARHLRMAVRLEPDRAGPRHELGIALLRAGRASEALVHLGRAGEIDPKEPGLAATLESAHALARGG